MNVVCSQQQPDIQSGFDLSFEDLSLATISTGANRSADSGRLRGKSAQFWGSFHRSPWSLDPFNIPESPKNAEEMQNNVRWRRLLSASLSLGRQSDQVEITVHDEIDALENSDGSSISVVAKTPCPGMMPITTFSPVPCPPNPGGVEVWDHSKKQTEDLGLRLCGCGEVDATGYGHGREECIDFYVGPRSKSLDYGALSPGGGISSAHTLHGEFAVGSPPFGSARGSRVTGDSFRTSTLSMEDSARRESHGQTKTVVTDYCELVLRSSSCEESMCLESDESEGSYLFLTFGRGAPDSYGCAGGTVEEDAVMSPATRLRDAADQYFHDSIMHDSGLEAEELLVNSVFDQPSRNSAASLPRSTAMGRLIFDTQASQEEDLRAFLQRNVQERESGLGQESYGVSPRPSRTAGVTMDRLSDPTSGSSESLDFPAIRDVPIPRESGMHRRQRSNIGGTVRFASPEPNARELLRHFLDSDKRRKQITASYHPPDVAPGAQKTGLSNFHSSSTSSTSSTDSTPSVSGRIRRDVGALLAAKGIPKVLNRVEMDSGRDVGPSSKQSGNRQDASGKDSMQSSRESSPSRCQSREFRMTSHAPKMFPWRRRRRRLSRSMGDRQPDSRQGLRRDKGWLLRLALEQADSDKDGGSDRYRDSGKAMPPDTEGPFGIDICPHVDLDPAVISAGVRVLRPRMDTEEHSRETRVPSPVPPQNHLCCPAWINVKIRRMSISVSDKLWRSMGWGKE